MFGDEEENANGPFARNKDGTAKDPKAFQDALKRDAEKLQMIEQVSLTSPTLFDGTSRRLTNTHPYTLQIPTLFISGPGACESSSWRRHGCLSGNLEDGEKDGGPARA